MEKHRVSCLMINLPLSWVWDPKDGSTIDDTRIYWMLSSGSLARDSVFHLGTYPKTPCFSPHFLSDFIIFPVETSSTTCYNIPIEMALFGAFHVFETNPHVFFFKPPYNIQICSINVYPYGACHDTKVFKQITPFLPFGAGQWWKLQRIIHSC